MTSHHIVIISPVISFYHDTDIDIDNPNLMNISNLKQLELK